MKKETIWTNVSEKDIDKVYQELKTKDESYKRIAETIDSWPQ